MKDTKRIVVIGGSPKPPGKAISDYLAARAAEAMRGDGMDVRVLNARRTLSKKQTEEAFALMASADALVFLFPLYVFCVPGLMMRFLQQYKAYADAHPEAKNGAAVYAVVNCGFPEPEINEQAVGVVSRFAASIGARFRFGVMVGSGGMIMIDAPSSKKLRKRYAAVFQEIAAEVASGSFTDVQPVYLRNSFPAWLYFRMAEMGWRQQIRKNGKSKKTLYAKPYQQAAE